MKLPFFILILLLVFGCRTPQQKLKMLIQKYPELSVTEYRTVIDSFFIEKSVVKTSQSIKYSSINIPVNGSFTIRIDSTGNIVNDSFSINKDGISIKITVGGSSINVNGTIVKKTILPQSLSIKNGLSTSTASIDSNNLTIENNVPDTFLTKEDTESSTTIGKCEDRRLIFLILGFVIGWLSYYYGSKSKNK